jgi:integrase
MRRRFDRHPRCSVSVAAEQAGFDVVFPTMRGTLAEGPNITHRRHRLLQRAGLPPMRFHDLCHACASLLLVQGVHPRVVMETLGHSQISLTMNTYSHVLPALQREAAAKMEAVVAQSGI